MHTYEHPPQPYSFPGFVCVVLQTARRGRAAIGVLYHRHRERRLQLRVRVRREEDELRGSVFVAGLRERVESADSYASLAVRPVRTPAGIDLGASTPSWEF